MAQEQRPPVRSIYELIEFGQFTTAGEQLNKLREVTQESEALRQLLTLDTGEHQAAAHGANTLLTRPLSDIARLWCLIVIGRVECHQRRTTQGVGLLREAVRLASDMKDGVLLARAQGHLCNALLRFVGIEAVLPELVRLREYSYAAGDSHGLTLLHCYIAEIELRHERYGVAARHLRLATSLCAPQDLRMVTQIGRLRANVAMLSSEPFEARRIIEPVIKMLDDCGARFPLIAALSSLAQVCLQTSDYETAEVSLNRMLELSPPDRARLAALDSMMQIALSRRNSSGASRIAQSIEPLLQLTGDDYYSLTHIPTRAKWLLSESRATEALELLRRFEADAVNTSIVELTQAFGFAEVETLVALNAPVQAAARLCRAAAAGERTLEDVVEINRLAALTHSASPASFGERAERIRSVAFFSSDRHQTSRQSAAPLQTPLEILYSVAAMFGAPLNSEVLAHEIAALLSATGSVDHVSLAIAAPATDHAENVSADTLPETPIHIAIDTAITGQPRYTVSATPTEPAEAHLAVLALQDVVSSAIALGKSRERERDEPSPWLENPIDRDAGIVVASNNTRELVNITRRVAASNVNVLFTGETGTGKELFAKALHESSGRRDKPFIPFNCTAVSRDMVDSQLFGYRRGAFTGAHDTFPGVIRAAAGGTLFLDEVGEISLDVQPKLLRFLESGEVHPLGELKPITVDVRVVAATNARLEELVAQGRFREDLFYRLNVVRLQVPPLRERREEIPQLVQHFLDRFSRESHKTGIRIAEETMEYLILFRWPGNVRQLANEIRRLVAMAESGAVLMPEHLSDEIAASRQTMPASKRQIAPTEFVVRVDQPISAAIEHLERSMIKYALEMAGDRLEDAAQMLGLSRKGLYLKRQRLKMAEASLERKEADKAAS